MNALRLTLVSLSLLLSACVIPPKLDPPLEALSAERLGLSSQGTSSVGRAWWTAFEDRQLDRLMEQALTDNPTLEQALARVREAQALAEESRAALFPALSFNAKETRERFSGHDVIPPPYGGTKQWQGREGVDLTWDIDFWGEQASLLKRARSERGAAVLDVASARLALSGAIAQAYVDLYLSNALADLAQRTEAQRQHILDITRRRVQSGLDTNVELHEASAAVPDAHVELLRAQAAVALDTHQIAALAGQGPAAYAELTRPTLDPSAILPLPPAMPVDLLSRRPDILAARARIEAASSGQAAAKAAFYPDVNLAAFAGTAAIGWDNLFQAASGSYGAGPAMHLPVFDAGRLRAEYRAAAAGVDQAIAAYNQSVLQAIRESADQLSLVDALAAQIVQQQRSLEDAEAAYQLAEARYRSGLSTYLVVLTAETAVLGARREHVRLISDQCIARVNLLLSVGGSFDPQAD